MARVDGVVAPYHHQHLMQQGSVEWFACNLFPESNITIPSLLQFSTGPKYYSCVSVSSPPSLHNPTYWWDLVRGEVHFQTCITKIQSELNRAFFVDLSPVPALAPFVNEICGKGACSALLPRLGFGGPSVLVSKAFERGVIHRVNGWRHQMSVAHKLPGVQWQRRPYWVESVRGKQDRLGPSQERNMAANLEIVVPPATASKHAASHTPLCGMLSLLHMDETTSKFEGTVLPTSHPSLLDHVFGGGVLFPGALYIELMAEAFLGRYPSQIETLVAKNIEFEKPMWFSTPAASHSVMVTLARNADGISWQGEVRTGTTRHAYATFIVKKKQLLSDCPVRSLLSSYQTDAVKYTAGQQFYTDFTKIGYQYGLPPTGHGLLDYFRQAALVLRRKHLVLVRCALRFLIAFFKRQTQPRWVEKCVSPIFY